MPVPGWGKGAPHLLLQVFELWLALALLCAAAGALDPNHQISQYAHTAWRIQDGDFSGAPHAITQTTDGYLWIGTEAGLVRFDGVRFVPWTPPVGKRLPSRKISSLLGASDGSLWIGTVRGLAHWKDGSLVDYPTAPGFIESILQDPQGTVWMVRSGVRDQQGGLCKIEDSGVRCYGPPDGIPFIYAQAIALGPSGNLWVGSSTGICEWNSGSQKAHAYLPHALDRAKGLQGVSAIAAEPGSALWAGTSWTGKGLGLQRFEAGAWKDFVVPGFDGGSVKVSALLIDHDGGLWVGTENSQLFRIYKDKVDRFGSADGLSSDDVNGFYQDREGDLWVVTTKGIDRFHDVAVATFSRREGLTAEEAQAVLAANDGTVWIANVEALDVWRQGKLSAITRAKGLPGRLVTSLFQDHSGRLWVGIDGGLTVYDHGRFRPIKKPDGKPLGVVVALTEDTDNNIWVAVTSPTLIRIHEFTVQEEISPPRIPRVESLASDSAGGGIWLGLANGDLARYRQGRIETVVTAPSPTSGAINNLLVDSDGSLWAATGNGLIRWKADRTERLSSRNGLPCDSINTVVADDRGSLWLDAGCGYIAIARPELEAWSQQPGRQVKSILLDAFDGAQPGITHFRPNASRSVDGKLWFANQTILQDIDPSRLHLNDVSPPVHIEQVIADHKAYATMGDLQLPALTRDLEIDYTALSLAVPQKVRFLYQLEGHDADWQDPQGRRQAFYTDLAPGTYRFHVIASNNDGRWNKSGATITFTVLPAYYQTTWFRVLCFAVFAFLLWMFFQLRLRQVAARMQTRLEERLAERERIARDLHDTLLQGVASAYMQLDVANDRLPPDSPAKPLVQRVLDLMKQVSEEGRNAIRSLRSPDTGGNDLEQVLARVQQEFPAQPSADFRIIVEGKPKALHPVIRDEVCRIAREAILNAFRHANAPSIEVEIEYAARTLAITVRDNGVGIDSKMLQTGREGHWGLSNMRERAEKIGAKLNVLSRAGAGTEVQLSVPGKVAFESATSKPLWRRLTTWFVAKPKSDISAPRE